MSGVEATLHSTGMRVRRMTHEELFLEIKRALNPLSQDTVPLMLPKNSSFRQCPQPGGQRQRGG